MPAHTARQCHHRRLSPAPTFRTPTAPPPAPPGEPRSPTDAGTPSRFGEGKGEVYEPGGEASPRGGPRTPEGKAVSARNATTHGLFARDVVLPHLGEDPLGYRTLLDALTEQLRPCNLMERQYLELWAEASWKMRRLARLEAQVWEDPALPLPDRLAQLEKLDRLESSLRRKLDKAVHMLGPDVPRLFAARAREDAADKLGLSPDGLRPGSREADALAHYAQSQRRQPCAPEQFARVLDLARLDTAGAPPAECIPGGEKCAPGGENEKARNEPPAHQEEPEAPAGQPAPDGRVENCENELPRPPLPDWDAPRNPFGESYLDYRRHEQQLYNRLHPDRPDTTDWDSDEMRQAYGDRP